MVKRLVLTEEARAVVETSLRAVDRDGLADQQACVAAGESVDGVSLWHSAIVTDGSNRPARQHLRAWGT